MKIFYNGVIKTKTIRYNSVVPRVAAILLAKTSG